MIITNLIIKILMRPLHVHLPQRVVDTAHTYTHKHTHTHTHSHKKSIYIHRYIHIFTSTYPYMTYINISIYDIPPAFIGAMLPVRALADTAQIFGNAVRGTARAANKAHSAICILGHGWKALQEKNDR
jgi:hypothetical protein